MQVLAGLMLLAVFILGYFAVGPSRSLTNPHHGIGVAIFVLFIIQLVGGRLIRHIVKMRSLRIMVHQWFGRAIALLGIVQVPLGLTLYGSPKFLFVLYALWITFLLLLYFALSYRSAGRRELYMSGGAARSDAGRSRLTESEYLSNNPRPEPGSGLKWLGPLAALGGLALASRRKKARDRSRSRSRSRSRARSRSYSRSRAGDVVHSRRGSESYLSDKDTELVPPRTGRDGRGGFIKVVEGAAAAFGVSKLVSGLTGRRRSGRDDDYSAVSTETPRRHGSGRGAMAPTVSEFSSDYTENYRRGLHDGTNTSFLPPSANPPVLAGEGRRPTTPRPMYARAAAERDDSDYTSYVSPSRRPSAGPSGGGFAKGILSGLGAGWFAKKMADRRSKREDARLREESELRAGTHRPRYTGDGHPSPSRPRTGRDEALSEMTESSVVVPPSAPQHRRSRSRYDAEHVSMPPMPPDPDLPERRASSRRRREGERAAAAAAARASDLAADQDHRHRDAREGQQASSQSRPLSVKLKVHDDRDRNVTLRRLTEAEEEEEAARATRGYGHGARRDSESSMSGLESAGYGRRYRREPSQQGRMERAAERAVERKIKAEEQDQLSPLSPPQPSFAKSARRGKDSAYYSGPGPSGAPSQTASSWESPDSHVTWSQMSGSPAAAKPDSAAGAEDRRRRRRQERRAAAAASTSSRPSGQDMFE
ncbi:hypothetical protein XA68_16493 [Ophiocordyceps unilateralis]|uniref:Cytochrome b561 domain-containing protein n=1 Tax=Ophiocordyceps unilateralis TaxID=268505 RepID=A0A2A9P6E7_OPHUN|nr:hypothetical protein XA68_16493 [Ophiocordyceps unilateralis]